MLFVPAWRMLSRGPLLSQARALSTNKAGVPNLLTLADLSVSEIEGVLQRSAQFKRTAKGTAMGVCDLERSLERKTIAIIFSKRSTRTRVASESSVAALGGHGMFLAPSDIQLGVNESLFDTARVVGSMVDGIMARVGGHHEVEGLANEAAVPVINALSSRFHPTQILADLLTMLELDGEAHGALSPLQSLAGKKVAWVGDSNNILNDIIVTYPRLGMHLSIAVPQGSAYERDPVVWELMQKGLADLPSQYTPGQIEWLHDPHQAVRDADFIVTDTWYVAPLTSGSPWVTRPRRTSACAISAASKSRKTSLVRAAPSPTGSSCTASPARPRKCRTRCSTDHARSCSPRPRTASGRSWPALSTYCLLTPQLAVWRPRPVTPSSPRLLSYLVAAEVRAHPACSRSS